VEGGVSKAGFNGVGASGSGRCETVTSFKFGATLKGFRGVESAATSVASPILAGKLPVDYSVHSFRSISSWRWCVCVQLLFESQVSVLQLKKLFSLSLNFPWVTAR